MLRIPFWRGGEPIGGTKVYDNTGGEMRVDDRGFKCWYNPYRGRQDYLLDEPFLAPSKIYFEAIIYATYIYYGNFMYACDATSNTSLQYMIESYLGSITGIPINRYLYVVFDIHEPRKNNMTGKAIDLETGHEYTGPTNYENAGGWATQFQNFRYFILFNYHGDSHPMYGNVYDIRASAK